MRQEARHRKLGLFSLKHVWTIFSVFGLSDAQHRFITAPRLWRGVSCMHGCIPCSCAASSDFWSWLNFEKKMKYTLTFPQRERGMKSRGGRERRGVMTEQCGEMCSCDWHTGLLKWSRWSSDLFHKPFHFLYQLLILNELCSADGHRFLDINSCV